MKAESDAIAGLIRAARGLLARMPDRCAPAETGLALSALALADRVLAAPDRTEIGATARTSAARRLRQGEVDTRAADGEGAALHAALSADARARLAVVNPRYMESLAREEGGGR
ncbi:MAG: hypothetical protein RIB45_12140 [Marivibrio sp.]|uniref:hypothetical protein n=1 Tax=Marivibrio sp. TaxID=2039719 RepID=UPI0032EBCE95